MTGKNIIWLKTIQDDIFFKKTIDTTIYWIDLYHEIIKRLKSTRVNSQNSWPESWDYDNFIENKLK